MKQTLNWIGIGEKSHLFKANFTSWINSKWQWYFSEVSHQQAESFGLSTILNKPLGFCNSHQGGF